MKTLSEPRSNRQQESRQSLFKPPTKALFLCLVGSLFLLSIAMPIATQWLLDRRPGTCTVAFRRSCKCHSQPLSTVVASTSSTPLAFPVLSLGPEVFLASALCV